METLYFTRQFTKGLLVGLVHHDSIRFPTAGLCLDWVAAINRKADKGKIEYRIIDRSFQNYRR